jgi:hypothetical protein
MAKVLETINGLATPRKMIAGSEQAQSAILTAALATIAAHVLDIEDVYGTGEHHGVDENVQILEAAFMNILTTPRPNELVERFIRTCMSVRRPQL